MCVRTSCGYVGEAPASGAIPQRILDAGEIPDIPDMEPPMSKNQRRKANRKARRAAMNQTG